MGLPGIGRPCVRRGAALTLVFAALAPAFAWGAERVGYAEPLENAAEATGAAEHATSIHSGLFPDYVVPGVPEPVGILLAGVTGTALVLVLGLAMGQLLGDAPAN